MMFRRMVRFGRCLSQPLASLILFMLALSLVLACSLLSNSAQPQVYNSSLRYVPTNSLGLGTNLAGIHDWSTELPFMDSFKSARLWLTQCSPDQSCSDSWDTQEQKKLNLDEHGWVKSLPDSKDTAKYRQVSALLHREIPRYPGGKYVVLYNGEGEITYKLDAKKDEAASRLGRDLIDVIPSRQGILLTIAATDPHKTGNYIRNIHVVPLDYESRFKTEIFNPLFLERIKRFGAIRFMDWMRTNDSQQKTWRDRPQVEDATYSEKGAPVEIMIELANRMRAHPWFNMPHMADDDYMRNFAQLVKQRLDPQLSVYVEFSNEVWNWTFPQSHYALAQGKARWGDKGDAFMQWYGMRVAQMSDIWKSVFDNQRHRLISIISTQTAWRGLEASVLDCSLWVAEGNKPCYQHGIDAYAITGYFTGNISSGENQGTVESWLKDGDKGFGRAFTQMRQGGILSKQKDDDSVVATGELFKYHQQVAKQKGLTLVAYEGGQSLVNPNSEKLTNFFIALNRHPEMAKLYNQLLDQWVATNGTMFMHFSDIIQPSKWGSWGMLEHVDQERSPKYDALMNFVQKHNLR